MSRFLAGVKNPNELDPKLRRAVEDLTAEARGNGLVAPWLRIILQRVAEIVVERRGGPSRWQRDAEAQGLDIEKSARSIDEGSDTEGTWVKLWLDLNKKLPDDYPLPEKVSGTKLSKMLEVSHGVAHVKSRDGIRESIDNWRLGDFADLVRWCETAVLGSPNAPLAVSIERLLDESDEAQPDSKAGDEPLATLRRVMHAPHELGDWLAQRGLVARLDRPGQGLSLLTPVLGPGALQIAADGEAINWDPEVSRSVEQDESWAAFDRRLRERADGRTVIDHGVLPDNPTVEQELVSKMRVGLHKLAFAATQAYAEGWRRDLAPLRGAVEHRVLIAQSTSDQSPDVADLATWVAQAVDALTAMQPGPPLLGGEALCRSLTRLMSTFTSALATGNRVALDAATVTWLTDVLWHAMTFDAAMYPRVDELALQAALVDESGSAVPTRHGEPPSVVRRDRDRSLADAVKRAVQRGFREQDSSRRRTFYGTVARALTAQHRVWERDRGPNGPAVAIVTSFDLELERALFELGVAYHVAIPVFVPRAPLADGTEVGAVEWRVGRFKGWRNCSATITDLCVPAGPRWWGFGELTHTGPPTSDMSRQQRDDVEHLANWIEGPLILKLNGSPLHDLREVDQGPNAPRHAAVLGEFDYLQVMRIDQWAFDQRLNKSATEQGLPRELITSLRADRRTWMLLGPRTADWSSRMQLFLNLSRLDTPTAPRDRFWAVSKEFDRDRSVLLDWLGVTQLRGDALDLQSEIEALTRRLEATFRETVVR